MASPRDVNNTGSNSIGQRYDIQEEQDSDHDQDMDDANAWTDNTPSYTDIHQHSNGTAASPPPHPAIPIPSIPQRLPSSDSRPPPALTTITAGAQTTGTATALVQTKQQQLHVLPLPIAVTSASGLFCANLELETDTVEIYDRSNDSFQYSLKGTVELEWSSPEELVLKEARIDFMGYADTAVLRHEAGGSAATEIPVHHTHDFIPTPLVLSDPEPTSEAGPSSAGQHTTTSYDAPPPPLSTRHHKSLPIDLTLPGHLPESTDLAVGKIRYELQVTLELSHAPGTRTAMTESLLLRRPILIHRIVYPSSQLQPRVALGLDSGGVEIQVKVPRLVHCENTLLAVELHAKPRTRNVKLRKARVVFEQIETDRYQRSTPLVVVPKAVVPLTVNTSTPHSTSINTSNLSSSPPSPPHSPTMILPGSSSFPAVPGPPPAPRLVTRAIAQPLEIVFEEPTMELQAQNMHLQLVLSPDLCVDVHSNWVQVSHSLRVEIEYTTEEEAYTNAPPASLPPPPLPLPTPPTLPPHNNTTTAAVVQDVVSEPMDAVVEPSEVDEPTPEPESEEGIWAQEGDSMETGEDEEVRAVEGTDEFSGHSRATTTSSRTDHGNLHHELLDEKRALMAMEEELLQAGQSDSPTMVLLSQVALGDGAKQEHNEANAHRSRSASTSQQQHLAAPASSATAKSTMGSSHSSVGSSSAASAIFSVATEEIPVRVVRVVATALVDASTIAQAAGETEAGLPTYESVIEATGLPAYAEEKQEDDHDDAEASGTATGVLGGAARRLEGDDAEQQRR